MFCTPRQYRDLIEAAKFKPPTHINCAGAPLRLAHQLHIHLDPAHLVQQHEAPTDDASSRNESVMDMLQDKMSRVKVNMELVR